MRTISKLELAGLSGKLVNNYHPFAISIGDRTLSFLEKLHVILKIPYHINLKTTIYAIKHFPSINSYKVIFKKDLVLKKEVI